MAYRSYVAPFLAVLAVLWIDGALAQGQQAPIGLNHDIIRGPSGYLAWYKLLAIAVVFLIWVRLADWINRDSSTIGIDTKMRPQVWNPISVGTFLVGFWIALSVPIFLAGFPLLLIAAFAPFFIYVFIRQSKLNANPNLKNRISSAKSSRADVAQVLPQDEGIPIEFTAAGSGADKQTNLIRARRATAYQEMKQLVFNGTQRRAEIAMLDFTQNGVAAQMQIDGVWHALPPMTRETGDSILASLKSLAGLQPEDRRSRQHGKIGAVVADAKWTLDLLTQGVPTGERAQLKFIAKRKKDLTLVQLGMWPDMARRVTQMLNQNGLVIVSAPPRHGLTASWRGTLDAADRITRDWVGIMERKDDETDIENIVANRFNSERGETPESVLRRILLTQPDAIAIAHVTNSATLDELCKQAVNQNRSILTRIQANSAIEALMRLYNLAGDKKHFVGAVTCVTGQKLARRLCETCKQPVQVQPQVIQQLGGDPTRQNTIFQPFKMPPPEQQVDEKGRPIEIPPCGTCSAIGYIGRIAIFETVVINDQIRSAILKGATNDDIRKVATKTGNKTMLAGAYQLVLLGITSLAEVQRVLKDS